MAALPSTYAEWYALPEQDLYQGAYAPICGAFEANAAPLLTPAALYAQVAMGGNTKSVFVVLGTDHRIHALHRWKFHGAHFGLLPIGRRSLRYARRYHPHGDRNRGSTHGAI